MKLKYKERLEIVRLKKEGYTNNAISKKIGISLSNVKRYLRLYNAYGEEGLMMKITNSDYSPENKLEVIERVKLGESKTSLACEYKIQCSMIIKWLRDYEEFGYNGLVTKKRGRPKMKPKENEVINEELITVDSQLSSPLTDEERKELIELRAKLKYAEMENEFLKKLDALVQERLKRERKK